MKEPSRIVILEGVEGAGKTRLARQLQERGWGYVHFGHLRKGDCVAQWIQGIEQAAEESTSGKVVVDRCHWGGRVYGPLMLGYVPFSEFDDWVVEGWLRRRSAQVRWMNTSDPEHTRAELERRFHGLVTTDQVVTRYQEVANRSVLNYLWERPGAEIVDTLDQLPELSVVDDESTGAPLPVYLLVGYQHNLNPKALEHSRLGSSFSGGCGMHLYHTMQVARLTWLKTQIVNAYRDDGTLRDLYGSWVSLRRPKVVGLGSLASEALTQCEVPHETVVHPSYARRFRRYDVTGYAKELLEALE